MTLIKYEEVQSLPHDYTPFPSAEMQKNLLNNLHGRAVKEQMHLTCALDESFLGPL